MLGTAQWGNGYGATNTVGRITDPGIADIVAVAREWDITAIDTAAGYGDAERRLRPHAHGFEITTKVTGTADVVGQVLSAERTIGVDRLHAVLIHDWDDLDDESRMRTVRSLGRLRDAHGVERVGVSVYDEAGVTSAVDAFARRRCPLGALQVPANVLDRRLDHCEALIELAEEGTEIVVRSVFLQGILLSAGGGRADHPDVVRFRTAERSQETPTSLVTACLAHVKALDWATHVVVGATTAPELTEICEAWSSATPQSAPTDWASTDTELIDPRRW